jgi:hypothetical protein
MNNPDHISESLETTSWVKILKFFDADPGSGMEKNRIRDGKNSDRDGKIRIWDGTQKIRIRDRTTDAQDWYLLVLHFPDLAGLVVEPPVLLVRLRILVLRSLVLLREFAKHQSINQTTQTTAS